MKNIENHLALDCTVKLINNFYQKTVVKLKWKLNILGYEINSLELAMFVASVINHIIIETISYNKTTFFIIYSKGCKKLVILDPDFQPTFSKIEGNLHSKYFG